MTSDMDRIERRVGKQALQKLSESQVAILGLGSLGSKTAINLAEAGVGQFVLIDPDVLASHNVVRHACDLRDVGRLKVEAVAELIYHRNHQAITTAIAGDARECSASLQKANLVIVAGLGSEIAQQQVGRILRELEKPVLFGGVYERAIAGEVFYVDPKAGPCYACFATLLRETQPVVENRQIDYGLPPDEVQAEPGLGMHVGRVAVAVSDWTLRFLINDNQVLKPVPGNLAILANEEYVAGTDSTGKAMVLPPGSSMWLTIAKQPGCLVCSLSDMSLPLGSVDELLRD